MTILNHITLDALVRLPMSEIVGLPAAELARLQKEAEDALRKAKLTVAWLNGALSQKYAEPAKAARAEAEKDFGVVPIGREKRSAAAVMALDGVTPMATGPPGGP